MTEEKKEDKGYKVVDKRVSQTGAGGGSEDTGARNENPQEPAREAEAQGQSPSGTVPTEITFTHLVLSLVASAYQYLEKEKNLPHAQQTIDALSILQEKTRGNLTKEEEDLLKNVLFDLRMRYVEGIKK